MESNAPRRSTPATGPNQRRPPTMTPLVDPPPAAIQVFLFRGDDFVGTELFGAQAPVVVGRHPRAGLRLEADTVSRRHCRLWWRNGAIELDDLGSGNGTYVNEARVRGACPLYFRDTLRVGPFQLKVRILNALEAMPFDPIVAQATTRIEAVAPRGEVGPHARAPLWTGDTRDETNTEQDEPETDTRPLDMALTADAAARLRDLDDLLDALDPTEDEEDPPPADRRPEGATRPGPRADPASPHPPAVIDLSRAYRPGPARTSTERIRRLVVARRGRGTAPHETRLMTPTDRRVNVGPIESTRPSAASPRCRGVEIAARARGRLLGITVLKHPKEEYILGYPTPQGAIAPARQHLGLRLIKINEDGTVDLVFPNDVGGHLIRGPHTVSLQGLTLGRKYSCLRLDPADIAAVHLGRGRDCVSYHLRFLRRPASVIRDLTNPAT